MKHFVAKSTSLFPLWVILFSIWAFLDPQYWSNLNFVGAMLIAVLSTAICYWGYTIFLNKFFNISL